jgi:diguanylate cyclase (GGDEF)-like protein/PAS domain S-box-containing protein
MHQNPESIETDISVYKTLLESTKAIPWKLDWETKQFTYIGPQIESLLGWPQASWKSVEDWASRMHADDQRWVVDYCVTKSMEGEDHEADYRALTADGDYVWIRDVVHVTRKENGDVEALIGFMFDISERKKTEDKIQLLQKKLEEYSFKDGLTGVPNRRMFDSVLQEEWILGQRSRQPLSLIMLDIDYFKQYNDFYGHVQGDEVLKRVATVLNHAGARGRDFFARFGGEEFALILPETEKTAALKMADRCRSLIFKEQILHEKSEVSQILTISMGVDTIIPTHEIELSNFIDTVDKLMYQAKKNGRNHIAT